MLSSPLPRNLVSIAVWAQPDSAGAAGVFLAQQAVCVEVCYGISSLRASKVSSHRWRGFWLVHNFNWQTKTHWHITGFVLLTWFAVMGIGWGDGCTGMLSVVRGWSVRQVIKATVTYNLHKASVMVFAYNCVNVHQGLCRCASSPLLFPPAAAQH